MHDTHTHTHTHTYSPLHGWSSEMLLWINDESDSLPASLLSSPLLSSLLLLHYASPLPQVRGRPQAQQDHAFCGQDRQVQVLPEGHGDGVHQEEDGGDVQHAPAAHRGGAGVSRDAGSQHPAAAHRQDMVVVDQVSYCGEKKKYI